MREALVLMSEPIALSVVEAAEALSLSRDAVRELLVRETDPIPSFRYGRRVVIPRRELVEWAGSQTKEPKK